MTRCRLDRRGSAAFVAFVVALSSASSLVTAADEDLGISQVDISAAPEVTVEFSAAYGLTGGALSIEQIELLENGGSLDALCWSFRPLRRTFRLTEHEELRVTCPEAIALSKELKRRGFRFVGPTTMYAFMQSAGMVDDHIEGCWITTPACDG